MIKKIVALFIFSIEFLYGDLTIAVNAHIKGDLKSAIGLSYNYNTSHKGELCFIVHSKEPIKLLREKKVDFAISDGSTINHNLPKDPNLRSIAALYKKIVFLIANKDLDIQSIKELDKKAKNIIYTKDLYYMFLLFAKKLELDMSKFHIVHKLPDKLDVDALFILDPDPSSRVKEILNKYPKMKLFQISSKAINQMIRSHSFLSKKRVTQDSYPKQLHDIQTVGFKSILLTTKGVNRKKVYKLSKTLLDSIDQFKNSDPIFSELNKKDMLEELVAPQDKEAIKAFNSMKLNEDL